MKAWIANDSVLGYTIWKREPFLVNNIHNLKMFQNNDLGYMVMYHCLTPNERSLHKFPEIEKEQVKPVDITKSEYYKFFSYLPDRFIYWALFIII